MIRYFLIILSFYCQCLNLHAQFFDDFSNNDLTTNPSWQGDLESFIVNQDEKLQLSASDDTRKLIYTKSALPDSVTWQFEFQMDFAPSDNNKLRIYLTSDVINTDSSTAYFLEIGENGANDAFHFYFRDQNETTLLGSGTVGALANDPAYARMEIDHFPDGTWNFRVAYAPDQALSDELFFIHESPDFMQEQNFILECFYTASRSNLFFFDNIGVSKFQPDVTGPEVFNVTVADSVHLIIQANEELDPSSAMNPNNYNIQGYSGTIIGMTLLNSNTTVELLLSEPLLSGTNYEITIENLKDLNQNTGNRQSFIIFLVNQPEYGDIVINEILFNPVTGGVDFLELLNISNKFVSLKNLVIKNELSSATSEITAEYYLRPKQHLCISSDVENIKLNFQPPDTALFLQSPLPPFNNDTGNVTIILPNTDEVIDAFNYSEKQHFSQLRDLNGVSLERINPYGDGQNRNNWFSAPSATNFGTPGYQNANFLQLQFDEEILSFEHKTFSPNQDGVDDQLIIKYNLPENGYIGSIDIFDQAGRQVRKLVNNELFSQQGFYSWDGLNARGELARIGIYHIVFEAFQTNGNVLKIKKPIILADYID